MNKKTNRGGTDQNLVVIAGPCAVESREQIIGIAEAVREAGATYLRAMLEKPRTNPESFQGVGDIGVDWILEAKEKTGLKLVVELLDPRKAGKVAQYADVLQIGSRNMQNYVLPKEIGNVLSDMPEKYVLLKRGPCAKVKEVKGVIDYLVEGGMERERVWFCERGIQPSFTSCRNTFDVNMIPLMRRLGYAGKVIADPSHATGQVDLVVPIAKAAVAAGADGIEIEVHKYPEKALCDGRQSITPGQFEEFMGWLRWYESGNRKSEYCLNLNNGQADIELLRGGIDQIDEDIIGLLKQRLGIVEGIKEYKKGRDLPIEDKGRENIIKSKIRALSGKLGLDYGFVERLFDVIIDHSKQKQRE